MTPEERAERLVLSLRDDKVQIERLSRGAAVGHGGKMICKKLSGETVTVASRSGITFSGEPIAFDYAERYWGEYDGAAEFVLDACKDTIAAAIREAVEAEREACAKICDEIVADNLGGFAISTIGAYFAEPIRNRSNQGS